MEAKERGKMAINLDIDIDGSGPIGKAIVDTFSPVSNLLGLIGDQVRVYRELTLRRTLQRARDIADDEGLPLTEPPVGFLVPYLEDCSLESPDDDRLIDMWARLLKSASANYQSEHNLFIRLMREMTAKEARLFEYLVSAKDRVFEQGWNLDDVETAWHDPYVHIALEGVLAGAAPAGLNDSTDFAEVEKAFRQDMEQPGSRVYFFGVSKGENDNYPLDEVYANQRGPLDDDFDLISVALLKSLGLAGNYVSKEFWFGPYMFEIRAYYSTMLGARFAQSCTPLPVSSNQASGSGQL